MAAQLALYEPQTPRATPTGHRTSVQPSVCVACRAREARYGFQPDSGDPQVERPGTLCFECFRVEIERRQARGLHGAHLHPTSTPPRRPARWGPRIAQGCAMGAPGLRRGVEDALRGVQARLPLDQTLDALSRRRRRAQMAARRALGLR